MDNRYIFSFSNYLEPITYSGLEQLILSECYEIEMNKEGFSDRDSLPSGTLGPAGCLFVRWLVIY